MPAEPRNQSTRIEPVDLLQDVSQPPTMPKVSQPAGSTTAPPQSTTTGAGICAAVPGYELLDELGRGGMGVVYKARQIKLNRTVALKMILAGGHAGRDDLERFRVEAEAVGCLQHPNIVQIHEVGEAEGRPYFSLEFCPGGSLAEKINGTPWPARQAAQFVLTLARAVHAAHEAGIVHRDLKPANVLFAADGSPRISDFGLAKNLRQTSGLTRSGDIVGTPSYMAPEQAGGHNRLIGPGTDVYALGAILYELLTGRPPFRAATPLDTVMQVLQNDVVPPRKLQPQLPRDLETLCLQCLRKEPWRRPASAQELADDLQRFLDGEPIKARRPSLLERGVRWARKRPTASALLGASLVVVVAASIAGFLEYRKSQRQAAATLVRSLLTSDIRETPRLLEQLAPCANIWRIRH
jgi:serine/threonine protein kinase